MITNVLPPFYGSQYKCTYDAGHEIVFPAVRSFVTEMLALKRTRERRPLSNHAKVWAAHSRPARSHGAINYRARRLRARWRCQQHECPRCLLYTSDAADE